MPINDRIIEAAKAVVAQWDTPNWKLQKPTTELINELRSALSASPSDAERHERAVPVAWQPKFKQDVIDHHRAQNPDFWEWTMTVFQTKEQAESYGHGGHETRPLYAAPPPPAAVQETVAVKIKPLEWALGYHDEYERTESASGIGYYYHVRHMVKEGSVWLIVNKAETIYPNISAAKAAAQAHFDSAIRSALSQIDPTPEIAALRAEIERLRGNLEKRDEYIVSRGMWSDFVSALAILGSGTAKRGETSSD